MIFQDQSNTGCRVRKQYERFPYPDIDPETQQPKMLVTGHLSLMCDILRAGKKSPETLRVLDAGCGTGSPTIGMALAYPNTDIVAIDFSETSLSKARKLAQRFNVSNVRFFHMPIEQVHELGLTFDFVISSGVLHHLADPAVGLAAIGRVLDPQGAVAVMVYGKYGRTGVYMLQEALKRLYRDDDISEESIDAALWLARNVPPHHPQAQRTIGRELQEGKDSGIVDLLLHQNDIPFDIPNVYRMCRDAGMRFHQWLFPLIYRPGNYFKNSSLLSQFESLSLPEQEEMTELIHGKNSKHSFFVVGKDFIPPDISIENGKWRNRYAQLTPCLDWKRTSPVPGKQGTFVIPNAIVQDAWEPLQISQWQLYFLAQIQPHIPLGEILKNASIRKLIPFSSSTAIDHAVEALLERIANVRGIVFLLNPDRRDQS